VLVAISATGLWGEDVTIDERLERAAAIAGYPIRDTDLYVAALTHASLANTRLESNERLEFLGDAVLGLVICESLYHRFPDALEGDLTKVKSAVVSRKVCAEVSDAIGLTELLWLGKGVSEQTGMPSSLKAAVLESFVAAIYLDAGLETAAAFVDKHFDASIQQCARSGHQDNFKSQLQQYAQKYLDGTPQYDALDEQGPDHSKCFEVCVIINGRTFRSAWGPSKKEAEQKAAQRALEELGVRAPRPLTSPRDSQTGSP
jgi:ribonuclease-3